MKNNKKYDKMYENMTDAAGDLLEERGDLGIEDFHSFGIPSGHTFDVVVQKKVEGESRNFGRGSDFEYVIDGHKAPSLSLRRGGVYHFEVRAEEPKSAGTGHPFYIGMDGVGGPGFPGMINNGVSNSRTEKGTITFGPGDDHSHTLYYQCGNHPHMGAPIFLVGSSIGREGIKLPRRRG